MSKTATPQNSKTRAGFGRFATITGMISGGVVGSDYALWFDGDPVIGALIGAALSWALNRLLEFFYFDHKGEVRRFCVGVGGFVSAIVGIAFGVQNFGGALGFSGGGLGGLVAGIVAGAVVAAMISFAALMFLVCSRGPIALFLKAAVLGNHEASQGAWVLNCLHTTSEALFSAFTHLPSAHGLI